MITDKCSLPALPFSTQKEKIDGGYKKKSKKKNKTPLTS